MANDPKSDLEQGERDTVGRPMIKNEDDDKKKGDEGKSKDQPKDPE